MLADIARQISQDISNALASTKVQPPISSQQFQTLLQGALRKCDLVTREEFDAQSAVLARTRQKLEALEKQLSEIEASLNEKPE